MRLYSSLVRGFRQLMLAMQPSWDIFNLNGFHFVHAHCTEMQRDAERCINAEIC